MRGRSGWAAGAAGSAWDTDAAVWPGDWVSERLGVRLDEGLRGLLGLALRRNPKRAHLLVSTVLGKHVPQRPAAVLGAGRRLGEQVRALLGADEAARSAVLGFAETATGLGLTVAHTMGSRVGALHSTRRAVQGVGRFGGFEEEHSHATSHLLLPQDPGQLRTGGPLVLVDDELSTGRTVRNTIAALHAAAPRARYVVAALVDTRAEADVAALEKCAADLGARVDVVALASGGVELPDDVLARGRALVETHGEAPAAPPPPAGGTLERVELGWPAELPDGGRHGFGPREQIRLQAALPAMAERVCSALALPKASGEPPRVLFLGNEELMYAPLLLARAVEERTAGRAEIRFSTTTRSPVLAVDDPGYAIRTALRFPAHDTPPQAGAQERYAYNVAGGGYDAVVAVVDSEGDTPALHAPGGLLDQLTGCAPTVLLAVVPAHVPSPQPPSPPTPLYGPGFSSYAPQDVAWLLRDLSDVDLEAPTEEREEAIQAGGAHYAESLPVEYQPSAAYQRLFHSALETSAERLARAVGTVTETVLAERGPRPVLVSLARAGTPVGVLMRRWALHTQGLELPHYAVSIVRGRGIDVGALAHLAAHHDPADVVFVDGWTGKGAITRELAQALAAHPRFNPEPAVLADPGSCVRTYGTREDFLIPSACLNSTVSGLISRTVLRADLVGPHDFHGAKFYRHLAGNDLSQLFVDTVAERFADVREGVLRDVAALAAADRTPTWEGWRAVEHISEEYGIGDVNLIKPGVGETTRVLLRRVPWRVLARRGAGADLDHVRLLARQRGVPVEETDDLPYTCVGIIHPRYTRGATGADGKAAR
ncbi:phosphoribosyltransferase [Streptomyces reniochalinae]|uniref:Phosphoribosyltransferase n=1 Tax=Streptomyces reniochalinae TaxID=2250578 RepID=A0A367EAR6_9ACTN|nr:phosphoribosyltransferase [Streptomyces reniochalinae]